MIIPLYNKREHVNLCLRSVLDQTFQDFEIIVIDDASTDGSEAELSKFKDPRITIIHRASSGPGPGPARNLGIREAKYPWCAFLDADDIWDPAYLQRTIDAINQLPEDIGFVFSGFQTRYTDGTVRTDKFSDGRLAEPSVIFDLSDFIRAWIRNHNSPNRTSATAIKTQILLEIGGFPESEQCRRGQDKETWLRAAIATRCAYIPFLGMTYRSGSQKQASSAPSQSGEACICGTITRILESQELPASRKLLRQLYNDEVLSNAKEVSRSGSLPLGFLRNFHIIDDPEKYLVILFLCLLPLSLSSLLRRLRRTYTDAAHSP